MSIFKAPATPRYTLPVTLLQRKGFPNASGRSGITSCRLEFAEGQPYGAELQRYAVHRVYCTIAWLCWS